MTSALSDRLILLLLNCTLFSVLQKLSLIAIDFNDTIDNKGIRSHMLCRIKIFFFFNFFSAKFSSCSQINLLAIGIPLSKII